MLELGCSRLNQQQNSLPRSENPTAHSATLPHGQHLSVQVPPVVLEWDALDCHWTSKKTKQKKGKGKEADSSSSSSSSTKQILHGLSGQARPGR
jgi:hypothetical protein